MRLRAFEEAVETHQRRVYSLAYYLLGNRQEAEDVLQEVLIRLWRHRRKLDADRLGGWLTKVTRNACYDTMRRQRSAGRGLEANVSEEVVELAADATPGPEERVASEDLRRRVETELRRLDEPYRSVLILREIQELKYREISEALELPLNTVRVYLHRGRRKVRERLRGVLKDDRRL